MESSTQTKRNHIGDLKVKRGTPLLGESEYGATEFGTHLGRRILVALSPGSYLVLVDATSPTVMAKINDIANMDEEDVYSLDFLEVDSAQIEEDVRKMISADMMKDPDEVTRKLDSGSEPLGRDTLIRSITRICEVSDVFPEHRMNARETFHDVMNNGGVNSDPEMILALTCRSCFMVNRGPDEPCMHCGA